MATPALDKKTRPAKARTGKAPTAPSSSGNRWFLAAILVVVVLGAAIVVLAASGRSDDIANEVGDIGVEGDFLPPMPADISVTSPDTDPAAGLIAPTLTGTNFDDESVSIGPDGSAKAVYFLAHWCPHCQDEVPVVQDLIDEGFVPEGLELYAVATSTVAGRANFPPSAWLNDEGFTPLTIRDSETSEALLAYGGSAFPYVVYLDADNQVVGRSSGSLNQAQIMAMWDLAVAGG